VTPGSDAEMYVARRYPHKEVKRVSNGLRLTTIRSFIDELPRAFQPKRAAGLKATYHFTFTGAETQQATVSIYDGTIKVQVGHHGNADIHVTADSKTWLAMLSKEQKIVTALLKRKIRIKGSRRLLITFGKCFAV
jgi:putative sterol carrier protein